MTHEKEHISVCICTYKRPVLLRKLLDALERQRTDDLFGYSIAIADNDSEGSGGAIVSGFREASRLSVTYGIEPDKNVAKARNRVVALATGDYIAFIDDDEYPQNDWLFNLHATLRANKVDGVLGPVEPYFEHTPPSWAITGGFFRRPRYTTGRRMDWPECRSGNVLFKRAIIAGNEFPFQIQFGTGSEDVDFFRRMDADGRVFIWCDEAPVYELVTPERTTRAYQLRLSLLRGGDSVKHRKHLAGNLMKALIAIPLYLVALPFLFIAGDHYFMKYLKSLFDHIGRVLSFLKLNPVKRREI